MGEINTLHQIFKRWKKRFFSLELPNRLRDSKTWLISLKRLLMPRAVKISPLMRETFCPLDSRTLSDPREEPSVPLVLLSKTQNTKNSEMPIDTLQSQPLKLPSKKLSKELLRDTKRLISFQRDSMHATQLDLVLL